jgi:hypothetical protein
MWRIFSVAGKLGALLLLAACSTTALESQSKVQDARQARVYFLRSTMTLGGVAAEIKVDDRKVGTLANNSSFFIDRAPGQYKLSVETPMETGRFSTVVQLRPSSTYYVALEQRPEFIAGMMVVGVVAGHIEQANAPENSGRFKLVVMEENAGAALLQQLKR